MTKTLDAFQLFAAIGQMGLKDIEPAGSISARLIAGLRKKQEPRALIKKQDSDAYTLMGF